MKVLSSRSKKRMKVREVEADMLTVAHDLAAAMHDVGGLDDVTMREFDALCLPPRPDYGAPEVRRIRKAARMSQPVFASLLGVDKSVVAQWERGAKHPSGPALRLLELLDPQKPESPFIRLRQAITAASHS